MQISEKAERELNLRCKIIYDMTKEIVENETVANKRLFFWAYHETWMLKLFPKCLTSKKAYNLFFNKYKKDIRDYDWFSREIPECRDDNKKRLFMHEHLTTSEDFKQELIYLYKKGLLTVEKVKELIFKQRVCWITREEDDMLNSKGYRKHRTNPLQAYADCGIEIYEVEKEDLNNIMIPTIKETNYSSTEYSSNLLEKIKNEILSKFTNYNVHYSMSYIQIWKKSWNNQGKRGIHFELTPQQNKGFSNIEGKENFVISFKLHNEDKTRNIMPQIQRSKTYFKKTYSFLSDCIETSINELIKDIGKIINIEESNIDNAHENIEIQ